MNVRELNLARSHLHQLACIEKVVHGIRTGRATGSPGSIDLSRVSCDALDAALAFARTVPGRSFHAVRVWHGCWTGGAAAAGDHGRPYAPAHVHGRGAPQC